MDKITLFGVVWGILLIIFGIKQGGSLSAFFDAASMMIVFGGAFGATCVSYSFPRIRTTFRMMKSCFLPAMEFDYLKTISNILQASEVARKEGILALDSRIGEIEDPFMARGLQMVVDGVDVAIVESVLTAELDSRHDRHQDIKDAVELIASVTPAFGMIGTIIGLVGLLSKLDDPSTIGPNMAIALITTFYGAVAANLVLIPLAKKLEERSNQESMYGEIIARGCLLIAGGTHPRIIQERLLAHLPDPERKKFIEVYLSEELQEKGGES